MFFLRFKQQFFLSSHNSTSSPLITFVSISTSFISRTSGDFTSRQPLSRMLDEYFAEQMGEIIRQCAATRQTMLFSATMTDDVKQLASLALRDPVKVFVNENTDVAANLKQEFVR